MDKNIEMMHRKRAKDVDQGLPVSASNWAEVATDEIGEVAAQNYTSTTHDRKTLSFSQLAPRDRQRFLVLVLLYLLQGIPLGLAMGSVPYLLKEHLSYGEIGIFSLASYPYSLKLLWSPIVDACYNKSFGRRKSWIVPIQAVSGLVLIWLGTFIEKLIMGDPSAPGAQPVEKNLFKITMFFLLLVFLCATQDIAVDGWALTLLSKEALSYASTAQTIGLNTGYFTSFTVFLAFNGPDLANKYWRSVPSADPPISLSGYLTLWGLIYLAVTVCVALFQPEDREKHDDDSLITIYRTMVKVLKLPNIQIFIIVHFLSKIGFQANEAVTNLKLLEKGFSKGELALTVLIDFPFQIIFGYYGGKWSTGKEPLKPWMMAFVGRLGCGLLAMLVVYMFPTERAKSGEGIGFSYFMLVIIMHVVNSFLSTIQFISITAFHTQIADPVIGGTYMTTLNTISNLGGLWPKIIVLKAVDWFTAATCTPKSGKTFAAFSCVAKEAKNMCEQSGGVCAIQTDGYYITSMLCITIGATLFFGWIYKKMRYLESLPISSWRV